MTLLLFLGGLAAGETASWTIPLEITIRVGGISAPAREGSAVAARDGSGILARDGSAATEKLVEPIHDDDYANRTGYDPRFLGVEAPLPEAMDKASAARLDDGGITIPYEHFSLVLHKARRLALFTASNVDLSASMRTPADGADVTRRGLTGLGDHDMEKWFTDPRVPAIHQLPDRFFTKDKGAFDKGHVVRREDVAWGQDFETMRRANGDTFHVTNCSPQVAGFNRPGQGTNWGDLEQYVSRQAGKGRLSVFAGPVLAEDDPVFVGVDDTGGARVRIPRRYWKVILAEQEGLRAFAFVLEQDLSDTPLEFAVEAKWRHSMVSIASLEAMLRLVRFPRAIHEADQDGKPAGEMVRGASGARRRPRRLSERAASTDEAAVAVPPPPVRGVEALARGPLTFRDHFLSLYQSIATDVARGGGASMTEGMMTEGVMTEGMVAGAAPGTSGENAASIILAAERVARMRAGGADGLAATASRDVLEGMSARDHATVCASLGLQLLEAKLFGDAATAARIEGELTGGTCDPLWAKTVNAYLGYFGPGGRRADPVYVTPAQAGEGVIPVKAAARVALIGDWGTGAEPARRILRQVKALNPDILIHLGDIYYSGTDRECRDNFEAPVEEVFGAAGQRIPIFTLSGNHDMYSGGGGYHSLIKRLNPDPFRQRASFFCLRADDASWQLLAMNTGRNDYNPLGVTNAVTSVEPAEEQWLRRRVAGFGGKTILLSHHQLFSAFSAIGKADARGLLNPLNPRLLATYQALAGAGSPIQAWFWGHEHNLCIYGAHAGLARGRCIGHGAIPVFAADQPYQPLPNLTDPPRILEETQLSITGQFHTHGFAMLTLRAGGDTTAEYFEDLNGQANTLYKEDF